MMLVGWRFASGDVRAAAAARASFVRFLRLRAADEAAIATCALIFGELVSNATRHAVAERVRATVEEASDGSMALEVFDDGPSFEPPPALPGDSLATGGRGLCIVRELSGQLDVHRVEGGKVVRARLPCRLAPSLAAPSEGRNGSVRRRG